MIFERSVTFINNEAVISGVDMKKIEKTTFKRKRTIDYMVFQALPKLPLRAPNSAISALSATETTATASDDLDLGRLPDVEYRRMNSRKIFIRRQINDGQAEDADLSPRDKFRLSPTF